MSDETDLVNRLRQRATMLPGILPASSWQGVCAEAAAELARLREHVALLDFKIDRERDIAESLRAEIATLRADLALCLQREGMTGMEYRGG